MNATNDLAQTTISHPRNEYEEETLLSDDLVQESLTSDDASRMLAPGTSSTGTTLSLDLSYRNIGTIDKTISGYNLTSLILNNNEIEQVMALESLVNLRCLDLSFNFIRRIEGLGSLRNLEVLSFYHNQIAEIDGMEDCKNIRSLSLGHNQIAVISQKGWKQLKNMTQLKDLNLSHNPVCNTEFYKDTIIDAIPQLRYLDNHMLPLLDWPSSFSKQSNRKDLTEDRTRMSVSKKKKIISDGGQCSIQNLIMEFNSTTPSLLDGDKDNDTSDNGQHSSDADDILKMKTNKSIIDILEKCKSFIDDMEIKVSTSIQDLESLLKSKVLSHLQDVENIINDSAHQQEESTIASNYDVIMMMELELMQFIHLRFESWNMEMDNDKNQLRNHESESIDHCRKALKSQELFNNTEANDDDIIEKITLAIQSRIKSLHQHSISTIECFKEEIYSKHRLRVQQIAQGMISGRDDKMARSDEQTTGKGETRGDESDQKTDSCSNGNQDTATQVIE